MIYKLVKYSPKLYGHFELLVDNVAYFKKEPVIPPKVSKAGPTVDEKENVQVIQLVQKLEDFCQEQRAASPLRTKSRTHTTTRRFSDMQICRD